MLHFPTGTLVTHTHTVSSWQFLYSQMCTFCTCDCPTQSRTSFLCTRRCVWRPVRETVTAVRVYREHVQHLHVRLPRSVLAIRCRKHFTSKRVQATCSARAVITHGRWLRWWADVAPADPRPPSPSPSPGDRCLSTYGLGVFSSHFVACGRLLKNSCSAVFF